MAITIFDEADYCEASNAMATLNGEGNIKFNQTASKLMCLDDFKCMKIGHDSTKGSPELATKFYFLPNNEAKKDGVNFLFHKSKKGDAKTISCKRVIYQNPNTKYLINHEDSAVKQLKIYLDEKENLFCYDVTPQFSFQIKHELFWKVRDVSCIYTLFENGNIVYYGETVDLKSTIRRHQEDNKTFDEVRYTILRNHQPLRKHWEGFFLQKYKKENGHLPKYNKQVPYTQDPKKIELINTANRKEAINA